MDKVEIIMRYTEKDSVEEIVIAAFYPENPPQISSEILAFPGLNIFLNQQRVYRNGKLIPLTSREFHTLVHLAQHPDWVFQADSIYESVWHEPSENRGTAVANVVSQLRHKLTPDTPKEGYIHTVIGDGYKFVIPE